MAVHPTTARRVLAAWRERCPIYLALLKPQSITLTMAGGAV